MMARDAAPQHLLRMISCGCKKGCGNVCSCRKAGLKCSSVCRHCSGASCDNVPDVAVEVDDFSESDDLPDVDMMEDAFLAQDIDDTSPLLDKDIPSIFNDPDTDEPQPSTTLI